MTRIPRISPPGLRPCNSIVEGSGDVMFLGATSTVENKEERLAQAFGWRKKTGERRFGMTYTILFGMHNHAKCCEVTASTKYFKERKHSLIDQTYSKFYSSRLFFTVFPFYLQTLNIPVQHKCVELFMTIFITSSLQVTSYKERKKIPEKSSALWHLAGARLLFCIGLKLSQQLRAKDDVSSLMMAELMF